MKLAIFAICIILCSYNYSFAQQIYSYGYSPVNHIQYYETTTIVPTPVKTIVSVITAHNVPVYSYSCPSYINTNPLYPAPQFYSGYYYVPYVPVVSFGPMAPVMMQRKSCLWGPYRY